MKVRLNLIGIVSVRSIYSIGSAGHKYWSIVRHGKITVPQPLGIDPF